MIIVLASRPADQEGDRPQAEQSPFNERSTAGFAASTSDGRETATWLGAAGFAVAARTAVTCSSMARHVDGARMAVSAEVVFGGRRAYQGGAVEVGDEGNGTEDADNGEALVADLKEEARIGDGDAEALGGARAPGRSYRPASSATSGANVSATLAPKAK